MKSVNMFFFIQSLLLQKDCWTEFKNQQAMSLFTWIFLPKRPLQGHKRSLSQNWKEKEKIF